MLLYDLHINKKLISYKQYISTITFLENFHFCYNVLCNKQASQFEGLYSNLGIALFNAQTKEDCSQILEEKLDAFNVLVPTREEIIASLGSLTYTKEKSPSNLITVYVLKKIEEYLCEHAIDASLFSMEHIWDETNENITISIGNILLLETKLNNSMQSGIDLEEKKNTYKKSQYQTVAKFLIQHKNAKKWDEQDIIQRTNQIAAFYCDHILHLE